jgi:hypothetical protein
LDLGLDDRVYVANLLLYVFVKIGESCCASNISHVYLNAWHCLLLLVIRLPEGQAATKRASKEALPLALTELRALIILILLGLTER